MHTDILERTSQFIDSPPEELGRIRKNTLDLLEEIPSLTDSEDLVRETRERKIQELIKTVDIKGLTKEQVVKKLEERCVLRTVKYPHEHERDEAITVGFINLTKSNNPIEMSEALELLIDDAQVNIRLSQEEAGKGVISEANASVWNREGNTPNKIGSLKDSGRHWNTYSGRFRWGLESLCAAAVINNEVQKLQSYPHNLPLAK